MTAVWADLHCFEAYLATMLLGLFGSVGVIDVGLVATCNLSVCRHDDCCVVG